MSDRSTSTILDETGAIHYETLRKTGGVPLATIMAREVRMTRRIGLVWFGALLSAASLPGCVNRQHTVVDQAWYARNPTANVKEAGQPGQQGGKKFGMNPEPMETPKFVPPQVDPPSEPSQDPTIGEKSVPGNAVSFSKKPPELDIPSPKPPLPSVTVQRAHDPLTLALQCVLDNRHNEALEHLKKYDAPTQELFIRLLPLMALMRNKSVERLSAAEVASLHEQLQSLQRALRTRTELAIGKMCFCESIKAYGVYKPLPDNHAFTAGTPNRPGDLVQLYAELSNFASEPREGWFETRLSSTVEILDQQGRQVWFKNFEDNKKPYRSMTQLHDYYNNYRFYVPHLPAGAYTLKLQVVDESRPEARRAAHKTLDFRVTTLPRQQ